MVYSVIPIMVYVFPLLVCPYAKTVANKNILSFYMNNRGWRMQSKEKNFFKKNKRTLYSQLIPLTTESATSLAPSSYTCLVEQSVLNTLSAEAGEILRKNQK